MASSISFWSFALEALEFYHEQFSSNRLNPFTLLVPKPLRGQHGQTCEGNEETSYY